jgi:hypothetical protein
LREWTSWCRFYVLLWYIWLRREWTSWCWFFMNCSCKTLHTSIWGNRLHDVDFMNCCDIFDWGENELHDVDFLWIVHVKRYTHMFERMSFMMLKIDDMNCSCECKTIVVTTIIMLKKASYLRKWIHDASLMNCLCKCYTHNFEREWLWCNCLCKCYTDIFEGINVHDVDYMNCSSKCYTHLFVEGVDFMMWILWIVYVNVTLPYI